MFETILKALPRKSADLEAKLHGVNGFTGRGEIEFVAWKSGAKEMEVELRGVAGRNAEIYADDAHVMTVSFDNGRLDQTFTTRKGDVLPDLIEGTRVDVRQNNEVILEGVLIPD